MPAIELEHLSKTFAGGVKAVNDISLNIPRGSVFGYLGPNGSGKTTCIRLMNGILKPDIGHIRIGGRPLNELGTGVHAICGVMTENAALYENLSGIENLRFFGDMHLIPKQSISERSEYLFEYLGLTNASGRKARTYSSGMKKKLSLAIAMLHDPEILFLDEPTAALDPESAKDVLDLIKTLAVEEQKTVFLCSHQLRYIETICTHYGFLRNGHLIVSGTFDELLTKSELEEKLEIRYLSESADGKETQEQHIIKNDREAAAIIRSMVEKGLEVYEARRIRPNLEDLYFSYQNKESHE